MCIVIAEHFPFCTLVQHLIFRNFKGLQTVVMHPSSYLLEIVLGELVCNAEQLAAGVRVCKGPDAQTVGGIQLPLEELAAGLLDLSQLEKTGCREQCLDVSLLYSHLGARRSGHQRRFTYTFVMMLRLVRHLSKSCCLQSVSHLSCGSLQLFLSLYRPLDGLLTQTLSLRML